MTNPVPRLRRLLSIIPLIQRRGGISLSELRQTLGVSDRELQGDLKAIMLCGVPPYLPNDYISVFIDGDHVTVDYAEHFSRPARLTLQEALALRLALTRLQIPIDGPLYDESIDLLDALDRLVLGEDMASLEGRIEAPPQAEALGETMKLIDQAIESEQPIDIVYYSASSEQVKPRRVRPYGRDTKLGNHYLAAYCERREAVRSFRIDRISRVELARDAEPFEVPEDFDLHAFVSNIGPKPGESLPVRVRFDADIARRAADDHVGLKLEHSPDGDVVIMRPCGTAQWAASWALNYGELAEILEPPEARAALVERLEAFVAGDA